MSLAEFNIEVDAPQVPTISIAAQTGLPGPPGPPGPAGADGADGAPGGTMVTGYWDYSPIAAPPPAPGQVRTAPEPPIVGDAYTIYLSETDRDGHIWTGDVIPGDSIRLRGSNGASQSCTIQSFVYAGGYAVIETLLDSALGILAKNTDIRVDLIRAMPTYATVAYVDQEVAEVASQLGVNPLEWLPFPLSGGWRSYPEVTGDVGYGPPEYAIGHGVVYLRGVLDGQNAALNVAPGPMPPEAHPTTKQRLILSTSQGITMYDMFPDGFMREPGGGFGQRAFVVLNLMYYL